MNTNIQYKIIPSKSRIPTAQVQMEGEALFYLHSTIHPREEALAWVKSLELTDNTCYVVLGAGLGYHVQELLRKLPANSQVWLLFTQSESALLDHTGAVSQEKWLADKRLSFLYLTRIYDMAVKIGDSMIKNSIKKVCLCRHFPAMRLADSEYKEIEDDLIATIAKLMSLNFNMKITTEYKFFSNYWRNFPYFVLSPGSQHWHNVFADLPVIIVAAGPSLNKNILELKKCADKAVIIAAGSALGALHKHGIVPHFLMVTDANPIMFNELKDFFSDETILIVTTSVESQVVANYPGPKCFFETWLGYDVALKKYLPKTMWIAQTGSVATAAIDFANKCGARTVILVGQDLAYNGEQTHADGVLAVGSNIWQTVMVPGYYGGEVKSDVQFKMILEYYNIYMEKNSHIDFINATEGGALIAPMRNLSLAAVHQQILKTTIDKNSLFADFMHREGAEIQLNKIIKHLQTMSKWIKNLDEQVQEFCDKQQTMLAQSADPYRAVTPQDIQSIEAFFTRIRRRNIYPYIASSVESWLTLLNFHVSDGMKIDQQYLFYWNIIADIKAMLSDLAASLTDAIDKLNLYERGLE